MVNHDQSLPDRSTSLWLDTTPATNFPSLRQGLTVDVAIVGGGLAGLTAAVLLKEAGKTVAVLESGRIVQGVTGHTTAKLTSLHTLIYDHLIRHFGEDKARLYGEANQAAIEQIAVLVAQKQIDCDFTRTQAFTYAESPEEMDKIKAETEAALKLGLPATLTTTTPLPFPVEAAIRFDDQAQFHPRKYLLALADHIVAGEGSHIFEETRVLDVTEGEPCLVSTEQGTITARDVIVASHFPFNDKAVFASRLKSHRSYVLALRLEGPVPQGMFINTQSNHSLRSQPVEEGELALVTGEGHNTGEGGDTIARYRRLERWARQHWATQAVEYRWSTQDNQTIDRLPYIGRYHPLAKHLYVATGFGGWGMTNSTVAGMLLRDLILGQENPWTEVYDPNRLNLVGMPGFVKQQANIARHFVGDRLSHEGPDSLGPGEGKIVHTEHGKVAMSKAEDGTVCALSPACTHMGCFVQWNSAEKSWDCPCHGSRFAADGKVIHGPAIKDLEKIETSGKANAS